MDLANSIRKIHLEELPNNEFKNEYIKIKEFVKPNNNRGRTEKIGHYL